MRMTVPLPMCDSSSTWPPARSTWVRTTSMPTPRPLMLVTFSAVEKPARKTSSVASRSLMRSASAWVMTPRLMATRLTTTGSMPLPSSLISMVTVLPSCIARAVSLPLAGLPLAMRSSGPSMPWSREFLTMCITGSRIASTSALSSSVVVPSTSTATRLPVCCDRSRTNRGIFSKTRATGCMRVFMICSCRSEVTNERRWAAASALLSRCPRTICTIWLRASTSSPIRFISLSSTPTLTRTVPSASLW